MKLYPPELYFMLLMILGFFCSILKALIKVNDIVPGRVTLWNYVGANYLKIVVSFLIATALLIGGILDENMNGPLAFLCGYASENVLRFTMEKIGMK